MRGKVQEEKWARKSSNSPGRGWLKGLKVGMGVHKEGERKKNELWWPANWHGHPVLRGPTVPCSLCEPLTSRVARLHRAIGHDRATLNFSQKARLLLLLPLPQFNLLTFSLYKHVSLSLSLTIPTQFLPPNLSNSFKFFPISSIPSLPFILLSKFLTFSSQTYPIPYSFSLSTTLTSIVEVEGGRERN